MGQKIHPTGFRLSVLKNWSSKWYANRRNFPVMLQEDIRVREYLKKKLSRASIGRIIIERPSKNVRFTIYTARPGIVIGKKGEDIEVLRGELQKRMGVPVHVNIEEIRKPEIDAQLIADNIAQQLEKRIMFRRAMKRAIQNAMRLGAKGIKIMSAGRLNGIEIARSEWYREGRVPLHTLRADIDYGTSEAMTTYGVIGVKVWVFKGEVMGRSEQPAANITPVEQAPEPEGETKKKHPASKPETKTPKIVVVAKQAEAKKITKKPAKAVAKPTKTAAKPTKTVAKSTRKAAKPTKTAAKSTKTAAKLTKTAAKPAVKSTIKKTVKKPPGAKDAAAS